MAPRRVDILGVGFDRVDLAAAAERIIERHAAGQRTFVITANPEFVMLTRRDAELADLARASELVVADGTGVLVASRVLRDPLPGRVPGRLLVPAVLQLVSGPVFLLGAAPGVAERAGESLVRRIPSLLIAGTYAGSPAQENDASIRERIQAAEARVLLVAYGMPAQERWIARNLPLLPSVRTAIG
ncbi:MAG: glycosyltransferase, partial [Chloroflexi bacterium]